MTRRQYFSGLEKSRSSIVFFLVTLVVAFLFALVSKKALKKAPVVFYILAILSIVLYLLSFFYGELTSFWRAWLPYFQRCYIAFAFFTLVMFAGVFPSGSALSNLLMPLRRQLSILGAIFTCGHVAVYSISLLPRLFSGSIFSRLDLTVSLLIALTIALLLIPLTFTSFMWIKKRMKPANWKRVQLLAYPFFLLVYVHLAFVLVPVASATSAALPSLIIYTVLFATYLALRVRRQLVESAQERRGQDIPVAV